jgi:hypothetical protein
LAAHLDAHLQVSSKEIFWSLLMCIAGNSVAKIKSKFHRQILLDGIVKHFCPAIADRRNFVFFSIVDGISKKHKLAYFIQLIADWYKSYIRQKLETVKKKFMFSVRTGLNEVQD